MPDITTSTWFPIATLLLGYGMKSLSDWIENRRKIKREREARKENRKDKFLERQNDFQCVTLLEIQEVLHRLGRLTFKVNFTEEMAFREGQTEWRKQLLPDDLSESLRDTQAKAMLLSVRVSDELVRGQIEEFRNCCSAVVFSKERDASHRALASLDRIHADLNTRIGTLLRDLDKTGVEEISAR